MARQKPLVCQHLENISRQALEEYQHIIRQYVGQRHGVYALSPQAQTHLRGLRAFRGIWGQDPIQISPATSCIPTIIYAHSNRLLQRFLLQLLTFK